MKDLLKKVISKIVDAWYGFLPIFVLFGIPCIICVIIGWEHIVQLFNILTITGNGSFLLGAVIALLKLLGIINVFIGFLLTLDAISKKLRPKWVYIYIIVTSLSILAYRIYK